METVPCKGVVASILSRVAEKCRHVWQEHRTALLAAVGVVVFIEVTHVAKKRMLRRKWRAVGEDVVVLHGLQRSKTCPSISPYVLKLETYLRMANIQYQFDFSQPFGPKGKTPWITINGEEIADSQLVMELLGRKFKKDFSRHLNDQERATARAFLIMNDEHTTLGLPWWRFVKDPDKRVIDLLHVPWPYWLFVRYCMGRIYRRRLYDRGIGRHSDEDIVEIIRKDMEALSLYLGEKPFLMGNTPCEVDCSVFGLLAQFTWALPGSPFASMIQSDYRNLLHYCIRMKERFWPDWEKHLLPAK